MSFHDKRIASFNLIFKKTQKEFKNLQIRINPMTPILINHSRSTATLSNCSAQSKIPSITHPTFLPDKKKSKKLNCVVKYIRQKNVLFSAKKTKSNKKLRRIFFENRILLIIIFLLVR